MSCRLSLPKVILTRYGERSLLGRTTHRLKRRLISASCTHISLTCNISKVTLAPVTVIADVKTRWDSVFYMLRRLRYLQQVWPNSVGIFISHMIILEST